MLPALNADGITMRMGAARNTQQRNTYADKPGDSFLSFIDPQRRECLRRMSPYIVKTTSIAIVSTIDRAAPAG